MIAGVLPGSTPAITSLFRRLVLRLGETLCLVLDVDRDLLQRRQGLSAVGGAEEQGAPVGGEDAAVRLRSARITQIECGQRLCGGDSSGHVAFLFSCLRLLRPAGSGLLLCVGPLALPTGRPSGGPSLRRTTALQLSTTHTPASGFP